MKKKEIEKDPFIWVPDNLPKLKKVLDTKRPLVYGLPMCQLYYTKVWTDHDGITNRQSAGNELLHAYRIIMGTTWNWLVSRVAGLPLEKDNLNKTISVILKQYSECNEFGPKKWNEMLKLNEQDFNKVLCTQQDLILKCYNKGWNSLKEYLRDNLCRVIIQKDAVTQFTPLEAQKKWKAEYGKDAVKAFQSYWQKELGWSIRVDLTTTMYDWTSDKTEKEIRECCWLSGKTIQRMLTKVNKNSKTKHRRKTNEKRTDKKDN